MISEEHLQVLTAACRDGDQAALDQLAPQIGLAFDLAVLRGLLVRFTQLQLVNLAVLALQTLDAEHGIASTTAKKSRSPASAQPLEWECALAVRDGTMVVLDTRSMRHAPAAVEKAWPELSPWKKELSLNRGVCERWATVASRARIPIVERPKLAATGARLTEAELMREIVAHPDDEAPRLVLADLLMQRNDVRGELIQLDHQLASASLDELRRDELTARRDAIVANHRRDLAGEIAELVISYGISGGFVHSVTMSATAFRKHGARLFALQPIRELVLQPSSETHVGKLATSPNVALLRGLELGGSKQPPTVTLAPFRGVALPRLERLSLHNCVVSDAAEASFAELDAPRLRALHFYGRASFPGTVLRGLATNHRLTATLEDLSVSTWYAPERPEDDAIADAVFERWRLPNLRQLVLQRAWFEKPHRIAALIRGAPQLRVFVQAGHADPKVIEALVECRELEQLQLTGSLELESLDQLLALPRLARLQFEGRSAEHSRPLVERLLALPPSHPLQRVKIGTYSCIDPSLQRGKPLHQRFPWPVPR